MTDDEFKREPIAAAPLSVLLLVPADVDPADDLAAWLGLLRERNRPFELLLVAAASRAPLLSASHTEPDVRVIPAMNGRIGALLRAGLAEVKHPLLAYTLANRQYRPGDLKLLMESIDQHDLVVGIRTGPVPIWLRVVDFFYRWSCAILFGLPVDPRPAWFGWRALGRRWLAQWIFGIPVHDPECVFGLVRRDMLRRIVIQSDGTFAPVELLAKANFFNALMDQVPVSFAADLPEKSFLEEAFEVFQKPDFGPAFLPEPVPAVGPALDGPTDVLHEPAAQARQDASVSPVADDRPIPDRPPEQASTTAVPAIDDPTMRVPAPPVQDDRPKQP